MDLECGEGASLAAEQAAQECARLVAAIGAGDRDAEKEFALRYMPRVKAMLLARSRNPDLAADLQQEVMIESICALRRGQLRESAKLTPFVLAIARNVLNSHFRGASRQPESLEFPSDLPDTRSSVEDFEERQREGLAMAAIESLDKLDREILQLTLVNGMKPGAIAEHLNINPDVVRQRKLRATRRVMEFVRSRSQKDPGGHLITGRKK
jgi:RNA polymerase sigma factor (sigma-70 family)